MKLATLLYIRNSKGEYLLMERRKDPNKGLMSPPGGKLDTEKAESPSACAVREAYEECRLGSCEKDWLLRGIITEKNFPGAGNIMIFLMEYIKLINELPPECNEGAFSFIHPENLPEYKIPLTDRFFIWDKILKEEEIFIDSLDCSGYPEIKIIRTEIF
jgi:8-oxo-dGTP pyrophosphatase MutT (NUDIX family)